MAEVVDRVSVEIVQANLLWGFLGGLVGLFAGLLGIIGIVIGIIALVFAWIWKRSSARMKIFLFGFGLVATFVGFIAMGTTSMMAQMGVTAENQRGLGIFGTLLSIPKAIDEKIGFSRAVYNVETGVPTSAGLSVLSRFMPTSTTTTTTTTGTVT